MKPIFGWNSNNIELLEEFYHKVSNNKRNLPSALSKTTIKLYTDRSKTDKGTEAGKFGPGTCYSDAMGLLLLLVLQPYMDLGLINNILPQLLVQRPLPPFAYPHFSKIFKNIEALGFLSAFIIWTTSS